MRLNDRGTSPWTFVAASAIRAAFGLVWAINAYLTWRPEFAEHYVGYLHNAAAGQPGWLAGWFDFWIGLVGPRVGFFVVLTRIIEMIIAAGLLLGLARKPVYIVGLLFSLLVWSTAEGFGGPYATGASNLGPGLAYVLVFGALIVIDRLKGLSPYSLDFYIQRRYPGWRRIAEWGRPEVLAREPEPLSWGVQATAVAFLVVAIAFLLGSLQSALHAQPATPENAAAAVSPLALASDQPAGPARSAVLPPLASTGDRVALNIEAKDLTVPIANGVTFTAWTFGGTVPAPVIHVRQGQTIDVTFVNNGHMLHSIDFHAALVAPSVAFRSIAPGETTKFSFVAKTAGAFVYHCGTPPVIQHMAYGMYGAIIVDPDPPLPPVERSFVIVQSEWYTRQAQGTLMTGDFDKMMAARPDEVVFNGVAFQYHDHPLQVGSGERFRIYFVNAGPNLASSFHIIGGMFVAIYPDGDAAHADRGLHPARRSGWRHGLRRRARRAGAIPLRRSLHAQHEPRRRRRDRGRARAVTTHGAASAGVSMKVWCPWIVSSLFSRRTHLRSEEPRP